MLTLLFCKQKALGGDKKMEWEVEELCKLGKMQTFR